MQAVTAKEEANGPRAAGDVHSTALVPRPSGDHRCHLPAQPPSLLVLSMRQSLHQTLHQGSSRADRGREHGPLQEDTLDTGTGTSCW